jgi:hypothetical protein
MHLCGPRPTRPRPHLQRKHDLPAPEGAGKSASVGCYNEAGLACLGFLARAQLDEVGVTPKHSVDLGVVADAVDFALALLGNFKRFRQAGSMSKASGARATVAYGSPS